MEVYNSINGQLLSQTKQSVLLDKIEFILNENDNLNDNKLLKQQYNFLKPDHNLHQNGSMKQNTINGVIPNKSIGICIKNDGIPLPKYTLCSANAIQLEWKQLRSIGAGYVNLGNTCFMNSVLQALTYCPPLVNYLLHTIGDHQPKCRVVALCMTCELIKHIKSSFHNSGSVIRPYNIFQRLKSLAKHFQPGRQEDSHEFLRYVIDNIWKSCIINWESSHNVKLDSQSKETTFINQIFGGYHRSQITCLNCKSKSDTYDYFMDFILDIKTVDSLEKALEGFIRPEILRNENAYKCSNCTKKVPAEKRFTVHRAPNVATFQLKRFDYNRIFGGKITKQISYPEVLNLRPYMSETNGEPINYKLFGVLVHLGSTSNSGHYFCYVRNSNNNWYLMDDSRVSPVSLNQVLDQQAYMLFYVRIQSKDNLNRNDLKSSLLNSSLSSLSSEKLSNSKLVNMNHKPNCLLNNTKDFNKLDPLSNRQKLNLPRIISENNIKKTNEPKLVNGHSNDNIKLTILSDIDSKIDKNLNKSISLINKSSLSNSNQLNSKKLEEKKVTNDLVKQIELMPKDKIEFTNNNKTPVNTTPIKTISRQKTINNDPNPYNRTANSLIINSHLSNNYYQNKQKSLLNNHNSWIKGESPTEGKTSSITSGSSTNSINSTTEWQVIDNDNSKSLKKYLQKRIINDNSSWEIKEIKSNSSTNCTNEDSDNDHGRNNFKRKSIDSNDEKNLVNQFKKRKDNTDYLNRVFEKKLEKMQKKNGRKFKELSSNHEALRDFYLKVKRKHNKKHKSINAYDERKVKKGHKKKHRRDHSNKEDVLCQPLTNSFQSDNQLESNDKKNKDSISLVNFLNNSISPSNNNSFNGQNLNKTPATQKNDNLNSQQFNKLFTSNGKKDVKSELNEMHLNLLGKNVNTWDGKKTRIDKEVKEDLEKIKKKSKDDLYNEDYDKGKVKKVKQKLDDGNRKSIKQNPFEMFYQKKFILKNDKKEFIKSI